jgi:hypothetical protein
MKREKVKFIKPVEEFGRKIAKINFTYLLKRMADN